MNREIQALTRRLDVIEKKVLKKQKRDLLEIQKETLQEDVRINDDIVAGVTDHIIYDISSMVQEVDEHVISMFVKLETAPGSGKSVVVTATNGTNSMVVTFGAGDTEKYNVNDKFYWSVKSQGFSVKYTSTSGTATGHVSIHVHKHRERELGKRH